MFRLTSKETFDATRYAVLKSLEEARRLYPSNWDEIRKRVLFRDGFKCKTCGSRENLEVHHVIPLSKGGTNTLDNLVTLCRKCHEAIHQAHKPKPLIKTLTLKPTTTIKKSFQPVKQKQEKTKPLNPETEKLYKQFIHEITRNASLEKLLFLNLLKPSSLKLIFQYWLLKKSTRNKPLIQQPTTETKENSELEKIKYQIGTLTEQINKLQNLILK